MMSASRLDRHSLADYAIIELGCPYLSPGIARLAVAASVRQPFLGSARSYTVRPVDTVQ